MILQESLTRQLKREYVALVLAIETNWKDMTVDLANTMLQVIKHTEINKGNNKNNADMKVLAVNIHQTLKRT